MYDISFRLTKRKRVCLIHGYTHVFHFKHQHFFCKCSGLSFSTEHTWTFRPMNLS